jgi:hypothetical protein
VDSLSKIGTNRSAEAARIAAVTRVKIVRFIVAPLQV